MDDLRLSMKDANEPKSMNTHLHVLEAFTNLYRIWPDYKLKEEIKELIHIFLDHIISKEHNHLDLFFDDEWKSKSRIISYGHDIEASWLLPEAAEVIDDKVLLRQVNHRSLMLAQPQLKD
jgi:mannobiose 2-epimerase